MVLVAEHFLTPAAVRRVQEVLHPYDLRTQAFYPDKMRYQRGYHFTRKWHYASLDAFDEAAYDDLLHGRPQKNVVWAIREAVRAIREKDFPPWADERRYLAFLLHFVADVHQPLHVGRVGDKGGNLISIQHYKMGHKPRYQEPPLAVGCGLARDRS